MTDTAHSLSAQDCLVAVMIAVSMSDANVRTSELLAIEAMINHLPVFANFDPDRIKTVSAIVIELFSEEDGLDALFGLVRDNLPETLFETAYALACDIAAVDGTIREAELRILEEVRYELNIDRLHAAAIERGARAHYVTM
ncbi:tellurite resistance TerB family protein [Pacificibacter sp.]|uniref:tellurite resistance TerB family protein n=1 Tax=Pacificibacter sp. TaxID=1917866 RepID=UPI0032190FBD